MIDRIWRSHDWQPRSGLTGGELHDNQNDDDRKGSLVSNDFWLKFW